MDDRTIRIITTGGTFDKQYDAVKGELIFRESQLPRILNQSRVTLPVHLDSLLAVDSLVMTEDERRMVAMNTLASVERMVVIVHGTDTMSYTASALSFMLENLNKPVILTGSQLPIGMLRTDGKENLITAIEIAAAKENGLPIVPEVCIFFENDLMRGNRTSKISADNFNAFRSYNYPALAHAGVYIKYDTVQIYHAVSRKPLKPHYLLDQNIAVLKLFPGISPQVVESILNIPGLKGVVMETFGSGNAPSCDWLLKMLKDAVDRGIVIVNVTQCSVGSVEMHRYETGHKLLGAGVISGYDSTTESAVTKLMFLFGHGLSPEEVKEHMNCSLIGEITIPELGRS